MSGPPARHGRRAPAWVDITGSNWWYQPHVGRGYDLMVASPCTRGQCRRTTPRCGPDRLDARGSMAGRGPGGASASNSTWPTHGRRPTQLVDVGHWFNEGPPQPSDPLSPGLGSCCAPTSVTAPASSRAPTRSAWWTAATGTCSHPTTTTSGRRSTTSRWGDSRFGTTSTFGTMNYWVGVVRAKGRKIRFRRVGCRIGHAVGQQPGRRQPVRTSTTLMGWLYANRDVVEVISVLRGACRLPRQRHHHSGTQPDRAGHVSVQRCPVRGELTWWPRPASSSPARRGSLLMLSAPGSISSGTWGLVTWNASDGSDYEGMRQGSRVTIAAGRYSIAAQVSLGASATGHCYLMVRSRTLGVGLAGSPWCSNASRLPRRASRRSSTAPGRRPR